jgi:hypothetical protein
MKNKKTRYIKDILNAVKSKQRSDEIREFGKPLCWSNIARNKKKYTRKSKHRKKWTEECC